MNSIKAGRSVDFFHEFSAKVLPFLLDNSTRIPAGRWVVRMVLGNLNADGDVIHRQPEIWSRRIKLFEREIRQAEKGKKCFKVVTR